MQTSSKDSKRLREVVEEAELAFWAKVAELLPEASSGDFPPDACMAFTEAATEAVDTWVEFNVPDYGKVLENP